MNPGTNLQVSSFARLFPQQNQTPRPTISHKPSSRPRIGATRSISGAALALFALAFAVHVSGQQTYPGSASSPIAKPSPYHYAPPDVPADAPPNVQAPPQNSFAPPHNQQVDQQPEYQPHMAQPQAPPQIQSQPQPQSQQNQQPQYAQPYAPQYSAPQQPYARQPQYAPQPYPDQQPYTAPTPQYPSPDETQSAAPVQALSAEDLEQLLAPIALYPDSLLAQVLAASTYPAQVAVADQWLQQMRGRLHLAGPNRRRRQRANKLGPEHQGAHSFS